MIQGMNRVHTLHSLHILSRISVDFGQYGQYGYLESAVDFSVGECIISAADLERETWIEPANNGLGSRYSTIELLPLQRELYLAESMQ